MEQFKKITLHIYIFYTLDIRRKQIYYRIDLFSKKLLQEFAMILCSRSID